MKYVFIKTNLEGFEIGSCPVTAVKILDLTEQEAMYYKNLCEVKENLTDRNTRCILIPESEFKNESLDNIIAIPETIVAIVSTPSFTSYTSMKNFSDLYLSLSLYSIKTIKKYLKNSDEDKLRDIADKLDQITGFYYHKEIKNCTSYLYPHEFHFVINNLKKILSEMTYEEFRNHMEDKVKNMLESYLKNDYDGDIERMNRRAAFKLLTNDFDKIK